MPGPKLSTLIIASSIASSLAGCAVGPNYKRPEMPVAASFASAEAATYSAQQSQAQFWKQFGDETLDRLVADALAANHDLRIAVGHLTEARAARHQALYDLAPTITASATHQNQQFAKSQSPLGFAYSS